MEAGRSAADVDVIFGVADVVPEIRVEVLLDEGTRLIVLTEPFGPASVDGPGAVRFGDGDVALVPDRERRRITVTNAGRRPVRVSSHYPFWQVNPSLVVRSRGRARVPPGPAGGRFAAVGSGRDPRGRPGGLRRRRRSHRGGLRCRARSPATEHARRHGPTAGDQIRLGDTDLWIRVERDLTEPADQALWGYAKNLRSRMTQHDRATGESELDAVIASAVIVDPRARRAEGRPGDQGRPHRRHRPRRQPRHHRRRRPHDRTRHVADPLPRADRDARRHRHPRPSAVAAAGAGGAQRRHHHADHRRVRGTGVADAPHAGSVRAPAGERRAAGQRARRPPRSAGPADRGRLGRAEDPRGLGRLPRDRRCHAGRRRGARHRGLPAHRRAQRVDRAGGDGRRDRRPHDPRLSRGGRGRRPHPRPARPGARGEHPVFLDHARDSRGGRAPPPSTST